MVYYIRRDTKKVISFFMVQQPIACKGLQLQRLHDRTQTHNTVVILLKSDQLVAETSTSQHSRPGPYLGILRPWAQENFVPPPSCYV
jgi:hypothetical protein